MQRLLDALGIVDDSYVCGRCERSLGPVSEDYKSFVGHYDEPITAAEPPGFAVRANSDFVLRHFACPQCATLFEVEMLPRSETAVNSISLVRPIEAA